MKFEFGRLVNSRKRNLNTFQEKGATRADLSVGGSARWRSRTAAVLARRLTG
jgi:hypothetical protein